MSRIACPAAAGLFVLFSASFALATPVTLGRTETATDHVSAGIGGTGTGPGTITITGVTGGVRKAFLYWHGIDRSGAGAVYDNEDITFNGSPVTGTSLGDAATNCWSAGSSRAFFADVTGLVSGNGSYVVDNLGGSNGNEGNGASLVVLYNDSNSANDHDLVFFEGNDSDRFQVGDPPGDPEGWAATLGNINYTGGTVFAELHVGDGQSFPDATLNFVGESTVAVTDTTLLYDGRSLPNAGSGRAGNDGLWDIHRFDITGAFGDPGPQTIDVSGMLGTSDCHSLVVMMLELRAGSAPCGNGIFDEGEECDPGSTTTSDCEGAASCINDCSCGCTADFQCNDGNGCTVDDCIEGSGRCDYQPACASGPGCEDTCDEVAEACRLCGHPVSNDRCVVNAVYVLQGALDIHGCESCLCDVDSSGSVSVSDALRILRNCVNPSVELQCTLPDTTTTTIGI